MGRNLCKIRFGEISQGQFPQIVEQNAGILVNFT